MKFRTVASHLTLVTMLAVTVPGVISAQNFYSTGANVAGGLDQNWFVSASHTGFLDTPFVQASDATGYGAGWISNNAAATNGGMGNYEWFVFRQSFDLTGFLAATAQLRFVWNCDDIGPLNNSVSTYPSIRLNGVLWGSSTPATLLCNYTSGPLLTVTGFQPGVNVLDFYVEGNGLTDGMRLVEDSFIAERTGDLNVVPEPATMTLLATGLISLAAMRRRTKR